MPTPASSVAKQVSYKKETTWGTAPGASGAQLLRRTESTLGLKKETYSSNEVRTDYQDADMRHGMRRADGNIKGELSPGTYKDFFAAALRRDFAAITNITSLALTIAAGGGGYTITRGAGSWVTDGLKIGDVIRITASANANNLNKNLLVIALTATVATVIVLNGSTLTAEGPTTASTVAWPGKKTYIPQTGHTDDSFYFEHWFSDIAQSEQFAGCKVSSVAIQLPPSGMSTIDIGLIGKDIATGTSQYFTSPTALTATGVFAAVNGAAVVGGVQVAILTGLNFTIDTGNQAMDGVVGSNSLPGIAKGKIKVTGQFSAYFVDATMRDYFINESEIGIVAAFTTDNTAAADFISFSMSRVKVGSNDKSDSEKGIVGTYNFTALLDKNGGAATATEKTTISIQDSQA